MKKYYITSALVITLAVQQSLPQCHCYQDLEVSVNKKISLVGIPTEFALFFRQFASAFLIHYIGQTFTNTVYTVYPKIAKLPIAPFISLSQTFASIDATNRKHQKNSPTEFKGTHLLGWLCATYTRKPATLIVDFTKSEIWKKIKEKFMTLSQPKENSFLPQEEYYE